MDIRKEIWNVISSRRKITTDEDKKSLHAEIMRLVEQSKQPQNNKLGVTIMTERASLAGNDVAQNRHKGSSPGDSRPKSL